MMKVCPACGKLANYSSYFGQYQCQQCNWKEDVPRASEEMSLNEYQDLAKKTESLKQSEIEHYVNYGLGVAGEAGEVADYIKKVVFHKHPLNKDKLKKELGDVLWYVAMLASTSGMTLDDIARTNIAKLKERYPNGFETEKSINRRAAGRLTNQV